MRAEKKHIIQKLVIDLELNPEQSGVSASAVQQRISESVHQDILPCLDRCFDNIALPEGITLRLDNLYLDLGELPSLTALAATLAAQIDTALSKQVAVSAPDTAHHRNDGDAPLTESGKTTDAFVFFLKTGRVPWWAAPEPVATWELNIMEALGKNGQLALIALEIRGALQIPMARKRLVRQFSPLFIQKLMQVIVPASRSQMSNFKQEMASMFRLLNLSPAEEQVLQLAAREIMCQNLLENRPLAWTSHVFIQRWIGEIIPIIGGDRVQKIAEKLQPPTAPEPFAAVIVHAVQQLVPAALPVPEESGQTEKNTNRGIPYTDYSGEAIYISNAGIVLIAPFLPVFFERLGLLEKDRLTDADRAACLLQYLATGQRTFAEYDLFLHKLLCDLEPEQPPLTTYKITRQEQQEARRLLRSVIGYWSALKDTSPQGLQVNFLRRNGRIQPYENGWKLTVEQLPFDILLAELPWTISYIQLPWMKKPLWVDWS